jgi:hypothetical protein
MADVFAALARAGLGEVVYLQSMRSLRDVIS